MSNNLNFWIRQLRKQKAAFKAEKDDTIQLSLLISISLIKAKIKLLKPHQATDNGNITESISNP